VGGGGLSSVCFVVEAEAVALSSLRGWAGAGVGGARMALGRPCDSRLACPVLSAPALLQHIVFILPGSYSTLFPLPVLTRPILPARFDEVRGRGLMRITVPA